MVKTYDVQEIEILVAAPRAFELIADPRQLPRWASGFVSADRGSALMRTPKGDVTIELRVESDSTRGTVDWKMGFPDGSVGWAHSRVVELDPDRCVYAFVLHAPPVPLEAIEGALEAQRVTLARELRRLKQLLEDR